MSDELSRKVKELLAAVGGMPPEHIVDPKAIEAILDRYEGTHIGRIPNEEYKKLLDGLRQELQGISTRQMVIRVATLFASKFLWWLIVAMQERETQP